MNVPDANVAHDGRRERTAAIEVERRKNFGHDVRSGIHPEIRSCGQIMSSGSSAIYGVLRLTNQHDHWEGGGFGDFPGRKVMARYLACTIRHA